MTKAALIEQLFAEMVALRRSMHGGAERFLSSFNITRPQIEILFLLLSEGELSVSEIAGRTGVTSGGATQTLESMARRGLITRQVAKHDRRVSLARLSAEGEALATRVKVVQTERLRGAMQGLEEAELIALTQSLHKLHQLTQEAAHGSSQ